MDVQTRIRIEKRIAKTAVKQLLSAGFTITVFDGEARPVERSSDLKAIMDDLMSTDEDLLEVFQGDKFIGSISLIYGNDGWDVISDYHVILEPNLTEAMALAERLETQYA
jgi:hypothetical protein